MYLLAILFPPLAVLICGKPLQALLNILLTALFILPGIIHALVVVGNRNAERRHKQMLDAMNTNKTATPES
jgi:uncharacterized membrane protein YqaE (UPF0057 family)